MSFSIQYSFDAETRQYIASVPELWLSDYGDSMAEADSHLRDMITLYFEETTVNHFSQQQTYA